VSFCPLIPVNEPLRHADSHDWTAVLQEMETNEMKLILKLALVITTLGIAGCVENRYPISGAPCGPDDPVKQLDANDCAVAPGG
jgi:hypothetical protein